MSSRIFRGCILFSLAFLWLAGALARAASPTLTTTDHQLTMANGFVYLEFDGLHPGIDVVRADFTGQGQYGGNLRPGGPGNECSHRAGNDRW